MQFPGDCRATSVAYSSLVPGHRDGPLSLVAHDVHYARDGQQCLVALLLADATRRQMHLVLANLTVDARQNLLPLTVEGLVERSTVFSRPLPDWVTRAKTLRITLLPPALAIAPDSLLGRR